MSMFPNYDLTYSRGEEISLDKIVDKIKSNKNVSECKKPFFFR